MNPSIMIHDDTYQQPVRLNLISLLSLFNFSATDRMEGAGGSRGTMSPEKMTSKPPDLRNDLQAPKTVSMPLNMSLSIRHSFTTPHILVVTK